MPLRKSVLVVDDSRAQRALFREVLLDVRHHGPFFALESGEAAVEHLERCAAGEAPAVDLVLLDRDMPRFDGFDTLAGIRRIGPLATLPVLMVSGSDCEQDIAHAHELGASDYLVKPVELPGWEGWIKAAIFWEPGISRWMGTREIVRTSCGPAADERGPGQIVTQGEAGGRVDIALASMETTYVGHEARALWRASELSQLSLSLALNLQIKDQVVVGKRQRFVRELMRQGWSNTEIIRVLPVSARYLEERWAEVRREERIGSGNRAALLR